MPNVLCRACNSPRTIRQFHLNDFDIVCCQACGSSTTVGEMSPVAARQFYSANYFRGGDYQDYVVSRSSIQRNFTRFAERLRKVQPSGKLLEVGCAYGFFLDVAQVHWDVTGIDIAADAIRACQLRWGGAARCEDLLQTALPAAMFDWVVAWDTVEHLDQPQAYVCRAFELLRPGGYLALTTGDISSWAARLAGRYWRLLTPPSHLTFFSKQGMATMLRAAGYHNLSFTTAGYERNWDFVAFRLLGARTYGQLTSRLTGVKSALEKNSFYVDLGDIMFVVAQKPAIRVAAS